MCDQLKAWESEGVYKEVGGLWNQEKVGQGWASKGRFTGSIPGRPQNKNKMKQEEAGSEAKADQARSTEKELCGVWAWSSSKHSGASAFFSSLFG